MTTTIATADHPGTDDPFEICQVGAALATTPARHLSRQRGNGSALRQCSAYREFWPLYLRLHATPGCRAMHYGGTCLALVGLALYAGTGRAASFAIGVAGGYGLAWLGIGCLRRVDQRPAAGRSGPYGATCAWRLAPRCCGSPGAGTGGRATGWLTQAARKGAAADRPNSHGIGIRDLS